MLRFYPRTDRPIPDLSELRKNKALSRKYPLSPILEPCIRANRILLCKSYYWHYDPRPEGAMEDIFLRRSLVEKLERIDQRLGIFGLRLLIQEGYRPLSVQRFVREVSVPKGLRKENLEIGETELEEKIKMFSASMNGDLEASPTPHLTGGAVDLTIVDAQSGEQVDMGKRAGLYNTAFPDALENLDSTEFEGARAHRRLLFWLASEQGIVTNPTEWWHLCYGDQMWAWATKAPHAMYGVADEFQ